MSAAAAPVATLDLRSGCRRRVARRPWAPGALRTLLTRRLRFDVGAAQRLLIVDEARAAAAHQVGVAALTTGRPAESVLLVLVGPAPGEITARGTGVRDEPFGAGPSEEPLLDLDAPYNPAFYAFADDPTFGDHHTAITDDTALGDDPAFGDDTTAADGSAADGSAPAVPAILWVGAVEGGSSAAAVDPAGPALRVLLDALRSPEVFDAVHRAVSAMPGRLAFPGIRAVVGRLPGELLRALRIGAAVQADAGAQSDVHADAAAVPELAGERQRVLLDPRPEAAAVIAFAPRVARTEPAPPEPAPPEADDASPADAVEPADAVGPAVEIVWTAATMLAGVLRLTPARDAEALGVLFPGLQP
ncbi:MULTISPECIES: hypothetical protein [Frankia]|uniref:Uncharacterized protein n=1 Tax=Frankia alni (strain DSM 45986 / CECT 9034 / ACN14a) TaxID=326424 RepID=Q0RB82_FRAAA|nr:MULTISPECIES: hypothetical protein [Frankia]CAJ65306.1 Hypothetical protein FRAAL6683 [Frankia alni ACN14a]